MARPTSSIRLWMLAALPAGTPTSCAGPPHLYVHFTQSGFTGLGTVTGSFAGVDLDGDGWLNSFTGEITAFSMSYSGSIYVTAFSQTIGDFASAGAVGGLIYRLGSPLVGDLLGNDATAQLES